VYGNCESNGCRDFRKGVDMKSAEWCREQATECVQLSHGQDALQIATLLMLMARCWTILSTHKERYDQLIKSG
jgi:hypothetical protein